MAAEGGARPNDAVGPDSPGTGSVRPRSGFLVGAGVAVSTSLALSGRALAHGGSGGSVGSGGMAGGHWGTAGGSMGLVGLLVMVMLIGIPLYLLVRYAAGTGGGKSPNSRSATGGQADPARAVLRERYARGDLSEAEYDRRLKRLDRGR